MDNKRSSGIAFLSERSDGGLSLEFDRKNWPAVQAAIAAQYGQIETREVHAVCADVTFSGENFTIYFEWDEVCLIPSTDKGKELLRNLKV